METIKISVKSARDVDAANAYFVTVTGLGDHQDQFDVHTNRRGRGLWIDGKQFAGTSQFSIGQNAREAIRRYFRKWYAS